VRPERGLAARFERLRLPRQRGKGARLQSYNLKARTLTTLAEEITDPAGDPAVSPEGKQIAVPHAKVVPISDEQQDRLTVASPSTPSPANGSATKRSSSRKERPTDASPTSCSCAGQTSFFHEEGPRVERDVFLAALQKEETSDLP
jgi:hypothetical protein